MTIWARRSERRRVTGVCVFLMFVLFAGISSAGTISLTGTLATPESVESYTFSLAGVSDVLLQTYGFGGGVNGAGSVIPAGGFDPFAGLFTGTGPTALFLDGAADNLSNYTSEPAACPPAGLATIGSVPGQCGDVSLQFNSLAAGDYTAILTDADYVPNAVYESTGYLGDGYSDLTGGSFPLTTCYDSINCNTDSANWALDVTTNSATAEAPEPATFGMLGIGVTLVVAFRGF